MSDEGEDAVEERIAESPDGIGINSKRKQRSSGSVRIFGRCVRWVAVWVVCDMFHLMSHRETGVSER